jgi:hypothetical protein
MSGTGHWPFASRQVPRSPGWRLGGRALRHHFRPNRATWLHLATNWWVSNVTPCLDRHELRTAAPTCTGYPVTGEPTDKERRFCANQGIVIVEATVSDLLQEWSADLVAG